MAVMAYRPEVNLPWHETMSTLDRQTQTGTKGNYWATKLGISIPWTISPGKWEGRGYTKQTDRHQLVISVQVLNTTPTCSCHVTPA